MRRDLLKTKRHANECDLCAAVWVINQNQGWRCAWMQPAIKTNPICDEHKEPRLLIIIHASAPASRRLYTVLRAIIAWVAAGGWGRESALAENNTHKIKREYWNESSQGLTEMLYCTRAVLMVLIRRMPHAASWINLCCLAKQVLNYVAPQRPSMQPDSRCSLLHTLEPACVSADVYFYLFAALKYYVAGLLLLRERCVIKCCHVELI
jgi:hypothetical protein